MKLGFYYHIPAIVNKDNRIGLPAFLGLFVDSLANEVDQLYCFFHTSTVASQQEEAGVVEYWCKARNIVVASLGSDRRAYIKAFFPGMFIHKVVARIKECDAILVRGPSPLAPYFNAYGNEVKIVHFIVGSYEEGSKYLHLPWYKVWAVKFLVKYMHQKTIDSIRGRRLLVNSKQLEKEYSGHAAEIRQVFTTTLTKEDYYPRDDTFQNDTIKILYTGRLDWAKGLKELFEAFICIQNKNPRYELHLVGWEDSTDKPVEMGLKQMAKEKKVSESIFFHGRKAAGTELFDYYRKADIFILPSYHEGFPRTIWEAMANSIPVICTPVGSIPFYLEDRVDAIFTAIKDSASLVDKIELLTLDHVLRGNLIANGYKKVSNIRLDIQAKRIIDFINFQK